MEFRDLGAQYRVLKEEIDAGIAAVIRQGHYISGPQVTELEERLAAYVGVGHCIACANGTDALTLALMALNIGPGDACFVPDFTFFATAETVALRGAAPVFVDVEAETFNMNPRALETAIEAVIAEGKLRPALILPVDLFGCPADYPAIQAIADRYRLPLLEDAAQGFGGAIAGKRAGSFATLACTSFFPAKPLGCYGDGGAVFTDDPELASLIRSLHVHGKGSDKYDNVRLGLNSRLDTLQAAILLPKLEAFAREELEAVNRAAAAYGRALGSLEALGRLTLPRIPEAYLSSWAQYTIRLNDEASRNGLKEALAREEIPSMIYYVRPMHRQKAFSGVHLYGDCAASEALCREVLSLPMHPYLEEAECFRIAAAVTRYLL